MTGFCLLRKEPRTFRIDRIIELIDVSTGEVFAAHEFIELIGLSYVYTNTQLFLEKVRYGLKVLMAVAAIDGNVYADELEAILRWADDLAFDFGIDFDDNMQNIIIKTARNMRPTKDEAIAAIEKCSQTPGDARRILKAIKNVVYADDGMQPEEHYLIRVLEQAALKAL